MIELSQALAIMDKIDKDGNAVPFTIEFITANKSKKTGGDILVLENVILAKNKKRQRVEKSEDKKVITKSSNQWDNSTRNLLLKNGEIRKCHIRLITSINNTRVIY